MHAYIWYFLHPLFHLPKFHLSEVSISAGLGWCERSARSLHSLRYSCLIKPGDSGSSCGSVSLTDTDRGFAAGTRVLSAMWGTTSPGDWPVYGTEGVIQSIYKPRSCLKWHKDTCQSICTVMAIKEASIMVISFFKVLSWFTNMILQTCPLQTNDSELNVSWSVELNWIERNE